MKSDSSKKIHNNSNNKNMNNMVQLFLVLTLFTSCNQQKSEKVQALDFAQEVVKTNFNKFSNKHF